MDPVQEQMQEITSTSFQTIGARRGATGIPSGYPEAHRLFLAARERLRSTGANPELSREEDTHRAVVNEMDSGAWARLRSRSRENRWIH